MAGMGIAAVIVMPIIYGVLGFIGGIISAAMYNLIAGFVGGIEMEFDSPDAGRSDDVTQQSRLDLRQAKSNADRRHPSVRDHAGTARCGVNTVRRPCHCRSEFLIARSNIA